MGYPPVVVNGYRAPAEITVSFVGTSQRASGVLPAGSELVQRQKNLEVSEISVKEPSGHQRIYRLLDLEALRSKRKVDFEVWFLSEQGLNLGGKEDLRQFKADKHRGR
jgi:hypothetical protein